MWGRTLAENSEILIDAQQRLHSLEEYFLDRLAVTDLQGQPRVLSEIGNGERRRFYLLSLPNPACLLAMRKRYGKRMIFARNCWGMPRWGWLS